jgi:hypothetical protein
MTAGDVRALLRAACEEAGGLRAWARAHNVSVPYVSDVLRGNKAPGPGICNELVPPIEAMRGEVIYCVKGDTKGTPNA